LPAESPRRHRDSPFAGENPEEEDEGGGRRKEEEGGGRRRRRKEGRGLCLMISSGQDEISNLSCAHGVCA
jgi:hypothetical protein